MNTHSHSLPTTVTELEIKIERRNNKVREPRWLCRKKIKISQGMKKANCTMVDFSSGGACLAEVYNIRAGSQIVMRLPHSSVSAEVMWVIGSRCGIQFAKSLTHDEILAIWNSDAPSQRQSPPPY